MTKLKPAGIAMALLLGISSFAFAQTSGSAGGAGSAGAAGGATGAGGSGAARSSMSGNAATGSSAPGALTTSPTTSAPLTGSAATMSPGMAAGATPGASIKTQSDVKSLLESQGYSGVSNVQQDSRGYTAMATKNGQQMKINLDANGNVQTMQ